MTNKFKLLTLENWLYHHECQICGKLYLNSQFALTHLQSVHGIDISKITYSSDGDIAIFKEDLK